MSKLNLKFNAICVLIIAIFAVTSQVSLAIDGEKLARTASNPLVNGGNPFDIYWDPGPPQVTTFHDPATGGIIRVRGTLTVTIPLAVALNGEIWVTAYDPGIDLDVYGNIIDIGGIYNKTPIYNNLAATSATNTLQFKSDVQVEYDVYELYSGKAILQNGRIDAGSNVISKPENTNNHTPYCIIIKKDGEVISREVIYFN